MRLASIFLLTLATGACASTSGVPTPYPFPTDRPTPAAGEGVVPERGSTADEGYAVAGTALTLRGAPYRDGGIDPSGFDCSGFVRYVFSRHGLNVPRTVAEQFRAGIPAAGELRAGDLVFFSTIAPGPSHVGIAIGGDEFVHAPSSNGEVRVEQISSSYWVKRYMGARRIL